MISFTNTRRGGHLNQHNVSSIKSWVRDTEKQIGDENNFAPLSVHSPFSLLFALSSFRSFVRSLARSCEGKTETNKHTAEPFSLELREGEEKKKKWKNLLGTIMKCFELFHSLKCEQKMESEIFTKSLLLIFFMNNFFLQVSPHIR